MVAAPVGIITNSAALMLLMIISSRTPEGDPNRCSICGRDTLMEPSSFPVRDAPCPHYGHLLWFANSGVYNDLRPKSYEAFITGVGKANLGPFPTELLPPLFAAVNRLVRLGRMPKRMELVRLTVTAKNWSQLVQDLEMIGRRSGQHSWAYSMGSFVRKAFKRVRALVLS